MIFPGQQNPSGRQGDCPGSNEEIDLKMVSFHLCMSGKGSIPSHVIYDICILCMYVHIYIYIFIIIYIHVLCMVYDVMIVFKVTEHEQKPPLQRRYRGPAACGWASGVRGGPGGERCLLSSLGSKKLVEFWYSKPLKTHVKPGKTM